MSVVAAVGRRIYVLLLFHERRSARVRRLDVLADTAAALGAPGRRSPRTAQGDGGRLLRVVRMHGRLGDHVLGVTFYVVACEPPGAGADREPADAHSA
jgi:hypothetical protein